MHNSIQISKLGTLGHQPHRLIRTNKTKSLVAMEGLLTLYSRCLTSTYILSLLPLNHNVLFWRMIQSDLQTKMACRRKSEQPQVDMKLLLNYLTSQTLEGLVVSMIKVMTYLPNVIGVRSFSPLFLIQYCQQRHFLESTLYFANIYMKRFLASTMGTEGMNMSLVCLTCIWIAVKCNQPPARRDALTVDLLIKDGGLTFTGQELRKMEERVVLCLDFELIYTTPYDYIDPFFDVFPWLTSLKKGIPLMLNFAITIPTLGGESAENLFLGVFLTCLKVRKCTIDPLQQKVLGAQIRNPELVAAISDVVMQEYQTVLDDQDDEEMESELDPDNEAMDEEI